VSSLTKRELTGQLNSRVDCNPDLW